MEYNEWKGFNEGSWKKEINVRDFIQTNYTPYTGNSEFLAKPTEKKKNYGMKFQIYIKKKNENKGVLKLDADVASTITSHKAGYIDKDLEQIVGLQTDEPLKRAIMPAGGYRIVEKSCQAYDKEVAPEIKEIYTKHRKTHNDGVFEAYTKEIRAARSSHIITGLPDGYGRGRIIGDYRRVALYGIDALVQDKKNILENMTNTTVDEDIIREREEISDQIQSLNELKEMASFYGFDISKPASNAKEAVQWTYFGYLAATKEQNGAAMSLGRVSTFQIYILKEI